MHFFTLSTLLIGLTFTSAMPLILQNHHGISPYLAPFQSPEYCSAPPPVPSVKWCVYPGFTKECHSRAFEPEPWCENFGEYKDRPRSIGPDMGGHCRLYKEMDCKDGDVVEIWEGKGAEPIQCPGLSAVGNPIWFKSMKCRKD